LALAGNISYVAEFPLCCIVEFEAWRAQCYAPAAVIFTGLLTPASSVIAAVSFCFYAFPLLFVGVRRYVRVVLGASKHRVGFLTIRVGASLVRVDWR
jgi:hypothetical protein